MAGAKRGYESPWGSHEFREALPCLLCGNAERAVLALPEATVGICEACAVHAHWIWRHLSGDSAPTDRSARVTKVKVLVPRLTKLPSGADALPDHQESYDLAMLPDADGHPDLPTADVADGESELDAVTRSLESAGLVSWAIFCEPLYAAYTPRGSLTRLYVVRAFADQADRAKVAYQWRRWPPWEHAQGMAGLYFGLRDVWPLLIRKHASEAEPRTSQIAVVMRKGATEYLRIQLALKEKSKVGEVDTSMLEYLRKAMTEDEKIVCKKILVAAELAAEQAAEAIEVAVETVATNGEYQPETTPEEITDVHESEDEGGSLDDAFADDAPEKG
jgi:hypothetical protein